MIFERTLILRYSLYTPYSIYFRMVVGHLIDAFDGIRWRPGGWSALAKSAGASAGLSCSKAAWVYVRLMHYTICDTLQDIGYIVYNIQTIQCIFIWGLYPHTSQEPQSGSPISPVED